MVSSDIVALFMEKVPDEIRMLRDSIAKTEADHAGIAWEHQRELQTHVAELKNKCEASAHSLAIALAGKVGTRRRFLRNSRDERRVCIMCGTEEVGKFASGAIFRFLFRRGKWKFGTLNGYISRTFTDPEWYFETVSVIRNLSFPTEVVLQHAFPPRMPASFLNHSGRK
jgi:hypothetical protein